MIDNLSTLGAPEGRIGGAGNEQDPRDPAQLIATVTEHLNSAGITTDNERPTDAYLAASMLLIALGADPVIDPGDHSAAADMVRGTMLERVTKTTTRGRRAL